jgi:threonine dehydrogenase-like Zn-dependent dehydrogenase
MVHLRDDPTKFFVLGYHGGYTPEERKVSSGYWKDGCFAEFARFPAENAHVIDERLLAKQNISTQQLAEVASVGPAMGAANAINVKAGETVLVMPSTGFFSSNAITAALGLGANVVAGSRNKESLDHLLRFFENSERIKPVVLSGDTDKDTASILAATPHGKGADAYIDFSPPMAAKNTHIMAGLKALKRNGRLV